MPNGSPGAETAGHWTEGSAGHGYGLVLGVSGFPILLTSGRMMVSGRGATRELECGGGRGSRKRNSEWNQIVLRNCRGS